MIFVLLWTSMGFNQGPADYESVYIIKVITAI